MSRIENAVRTPEDDFIVEYNSTRELPLSEFEQTRLRNLLMKYKSAVNHQRKPSRASQQEMTFIRKHRISLNATNEERVEHIISNVCQHLTIDRKIMMGKGRYTLYVYGRAICMHFMYATTSMSLAAIGKLFNRDHTTVMSSNKSYFDELQINEKYREDYQFFLKIFTNGKRNTFSFRTRQGEEH